MTLTPDDALFLQTICRYFHENGDWPTLRWLERELFDCEDINVFDLYKKLMGQMHNTIIPLSILQGHHQTKLTVYTLGICLIQGIYPKIREDLNVFISAVRICVNKYFSDITPLEITESELIKTLGVTEKIAKNVFLIAESDTNVYRMISDAPEWRLVINDNVRAYRKVQTIQDYLAILDKSEPKSVNISQKQTDIQTQAQSVGTHVFVVHGHDNAAKHELARYIERVGLEAIILDEQPSQGKTIIEKFEHYSESVGFAVVLLTPDDVSTSKDSPTNTHEQARPNVLFELGYFVGRLGRGKVCLLRKGHTDIPSDLLGVVYISLDNGDWKIQLGKELRQAGLPADMNKL